MDRLVLERDDDMFMGLDLDIAFGTTTDATDNLIPPTLGEYFDKIIAKVGVEQKTDACFSMVAYHRLRHALAEVRPDLRRVHPDQDLNQLMRPSEIEAFRRQVATRYGFVFERSLALTDISLAVVLAIFLGGSGAGIGILWEYLGVWAVMGSLVGSTIGSIAVTPSLPVCFHPKTSSLRAIAQSMVAFNIGKLVREFGLPRERDLWRAFVDVMSHSLDRNLEGVRRGTRFA